MSHYAENPLECYEEWDVTTPLLLSRSHLYPLRPIGIGTPYVESLSSYITRLAEAHHVLTGTLLGKELVPLLRQSSPYVGSFYKGLGALNGVGSLAAQWIQLLEVQTLQTGLRSLTLSPWAEVLPAKNLLRPIRAWCPACYHDWSKCGQVIYEPLLWTLEVVSACPRHRRHLQMQCPALNCRRALPWLSPQARPGFCSYCQCWLGLPHNARPKRSEQLSEQELAWQTWVGKAAGALLAVRESLGLPARDRLTRAIVACVEQVAQGKKYTFAEILGVDPVKIHSWYAGRSIPVFAELLRLCYRLGIFPLALLTAGEVVIDIDGITPASEPWWLSKKLRPPPRRCDVQILRQELEAILGEQEGPPPSLQEAARRLRYNVQAMRRQCPELCDQIVARYAEYLQARKQQRMEKIAQEIRQVVLQLHKDGIYPSHDQVEAAMKRAGCLRDAEARAVWHEVLEELGLRQ